MNGSAFNDIEKLEADLWQAADQLRASRMDPLAPIVR